MAKAKDDTSSGTALAVLDAEKQKAVAVYDYGDAGGSGFEGGADAFKMPWLRVAQSNTPQIETVDGMKAGCIFNTVTNQFWPADVGILYIPALFQQTIVEWVPRAEGGGGGAGFAGLHDFNSSLYQNAVKALGPQGKFTRDDEGKIIKPKHPETGNELVDTRYAWGLHVVPETGEVTPSCIAFSSTHIPAFINWSTSAQLQTYLNAATGKRLQKPLYAHVYRITTEKKEKDGNRWHVPVVKFANGDPAKSLVDPASDLFSAARDLIAAVKAGQFKIDYDQQGGNEGGGGESAPSGAGGKGNVPF